MKPRLQKSRRPGHGKSYTMSEIELGDQAARGRKNAAFSFVDLGGVSGGEKQDADLRGVRWAAVCRSLDLVT
jgi:hypothetical protein